MLVLAGFLLIPLNPALADYKPKEFSIETSAKGFPGAKANIKARLNVPPEEVWITILDVNNHDKYYPRMKRSFCISSQDAQEAKRIKLLNGATVNKRYKEKRCDPYASRKRGETWTYFYFQEIDYPFPLADRWIISEVINDESKAALGIFHQKGQLLYGRQDIYEFELTFKPHPKNPKETQFEMYLWTDPGGFIADWMIKEAAEYIAPKYLEVMEIKTQERMGILPDKTELAEQSKDKKK